MQLLQLGNMYIRPEDITEQNKQKTAYMPFIRNFYSEAAFQTI